jgi:hypothetical protein
VERDPLHKARQNFGLGVKMMGHLNLALLAPVLCGRLILMCERRRCRWRLGLTLGPLTDMLALSDSPALRVLARSRARCAA